MGRVVGFGDREGRSIVLRDKFDVMVSSKLDGCNVRLLDCRVDGVSDGDVVGVVRQCGAICLNDNSTVTFGQKRRDCFRACWRHSGRGGRSSGSFLGQGKGREWCNIRKKLPCVRYGAVAF